MVILFHFKEVCIIVRSKIWSGKRNFFQNIVPEEYLMIETVPECRVGGSLHDRSNEQGKSPVLHIEKAETTIFTVPVESQLSRFLQQILVQPRFDSGVDVGNVRLRLADGGTFKPDFGQSIRIG